MLGISQSSYLLLRYKTMYVCSLVPLIMLICNSVGSTKGVVVSPSSIVIKVGNAAESPMQELPGGLYVSLPFEQDDAYTTISVTLSQPLTDRVTGTTLPADRLMLGIDTLNQFPQTGVATLPNIGLGPQNLRIGIKAALFDSPGVYESKLRLAVGDNDSMATYLPISVEIQPWTEMKLVVGRAWLSPDGLEPEFGSYLSSGEQQVVYVASNSRWQLLARASKEMRPESSPVYPPIANDLRLRVLASPWLQPITAGFLVVPTDQPTVVAMGKPTGDCPDGWLPVGVELRFPFDRQKAAGTYHSSIVLGTAIY